MNLPAFTKPVLLVGREHMNRSVDGDVVAVEIFPESEWKAAGDEVVDQDCAYFFSMVNTSHLIEFLSCFEG